MLPATIYQFRKQRGVNLGCWFVLERWITSHPFRNAVDPAHSDLDIAKGSNARAVLEEHYDSWITEADWAWIVDHGFNTVRIPIGFYHLCAIDPSVLVDTDFANLDHVYSGAWSRILQAIETAHRFDLGVLLDLHAAPGKQNPDAHSGTCNPATFFSDHRKQQKTLNVIRTLALQVKGLPNVVGIELLNEPHPTSDDGLKKWYTEAFAVLADVGSELPVYISDCWKPEVYAEFIKSTEKKPSLLVLDHHLYRCFAANDTRTSVAVHTKALSEDKTIARIAEALDQVGAGLVIGEWSGALNPASLTGSPNERKEYIASQLALYTARCGGNYFWTYKKAGDQPDYGWSLRDAIDGDHFPSRMGTLLVKSFAGDQTRWKQARDRFRDAAYGIGIRDPTHLIYNFFFTAAHVAYWSRYPGNYHHARFSEGFLLGWDNAYAFLTFNNSTDKAISELGFVGGLAHTKTSDYGDGFWEFRRYFAIDAVHSSCHLEGHGFGQGVAAANKDFCDHYCRPLHRVGW
ncbi:Glucan 1,3-beta-glucosidase 3 [Mycena indigotica]|uniref:Glucan 1,3-beta-glucosidase 3 n=1 Tax=Mycena indigotica TaxID=2126181 RepID=A0A8H6T380_9AGAR|nr:Glucan 1,3-beta-glucosidase 3 [Mycena indigotica]KAF7309532.1 Glucan 1,3-beta-glucosidase 3 [Mycena indigotica]